MFQAYESKWHLVSQGALLHCIAGGAESRSTEGKGRGVLSAVGIISHFAFAGLKKRLEKRDLKWKIIHPRILCQIHEDVVGDRRRRVFMEKVRKASRLLPNIDGANSG